MEKTYDNDTENICKKCFYNDGCPNPRMCGKPSKYEYCYACVFYKPNNPIKYLILSISRKLYFRLFKKW